MIIASEEVTMLILKITQFYNIKHVTGFLYISHCIILSVNKYKVIVGLCGNSS